MSAPCLPGLFSVPERVTLHQPKRKSRTVLLAEFFRAHPHQWVDGLKLSFAGSYAWRTRVSDLRRPPFSMTIEQRERRLYDGSKISEYRWVP